METPVKGQIPYSYRGGTHTPAKELVVDLGLSVSLHNIIAVWMEAKLGRSGTHVHEPLHRGVRPVTGRLGRENERQVSLDC